jgi:hypothetical protein
MIKAIFASDSNQDVLPNGGMVLLLTSRCKGFLSCLTCRVIFKMASVHPVLNPTQCQQVDGQSTLSLCHVLTKGPPPSSILGAGFKVVGWLGISYHTNPGRANLALVLLQVGTIRVDKFSFTILECRCADISMYSLTVVPMCSTVLEYR